MPDWNPIYPADATLPPENWEDQDPVPSTSGGVNVELIAEQVQEDRERAETAADAAVVARNDTEDLRDQTSALRDLTAVDAAAAAVSASDAAAVIGDPVVTGEFPGILTIAIDPSTGEKFALQDKKGALLIPSVQDAWPQAAVPGSPSAEFLLATNEPYERLENDGRVFNPFNDALDEAYVASGALRLADATSDIELFASTAGPFYMARMASGGTVKTVMDLPAYGGGTVRRTRIAGTRLPTKGLFPSDNIVRDIIGGFQSNSVGGGSGSLYDDILRVGGAGFTGRLFRAQCDANEIRLGLNTNSGSDPVLDPNEMTGLSPLGNKLYPQVEPVTGNQGTFSCPVEFHAMRLAHFAHQATGLLPPYLCAVALGESSETADRLNSGGGTTNYANILAYVTKMKTLCEAEGLGYEVAIIDLEGGEADSDNENADFVADVTDWMDNLRDDIQAITGQTSPIYVVAAPPSSFITTKTQAVLGWREMHGANGIYISNPTYAETVNDPADEDTWNTDFLHHTGFGYVLMGEGDALICGIPLLFGDRVPAPLLLESVNAVSTTETDLVFSEAITVDTTLMSAATNHGIVIKSDTVTPAISTITQPAADTLRYTHAAISGANQRAEVALEGHPGARGASTIPRTNIRSTAMIGSSFWKARPIYKWLHHDSVARV